MGEFYHVTVVSYPWITARGLELILALFNPGHLKQGQRGACSNHWLGLCFGILIGRDDSEDSREYRKIISGEWEDAPS
jgi:hypothetical protein